MIKDYKNINDYLSHSKLGIEKKLENFVIYNYEEVSEGAFITQSAFRHHFFEFSLEINKGCSFQIDEFSFPRQDRRLTMIAPNRLQTNVAQTNLSEKSKGFTIFFKKDFLGGTFFKKRNYSDYAFLNPQHSPSFRLKKKELDEMIQLFELINYEQKEYGQRSVGIIQNLTRVILEKTKYLKSTGTPILPYSPLVSEFLLLSQNHFLEWHTVKEFAQKLHVTPKHLTETVKKQTGISALQTIHNAKINYAKGLLSQTQLTVKEIAYELGFVNPEYFNVFFKRSEGQTPTQFRQI